MTKFSLGTEGVLRKPRRKEEASLQVQVMNVLDRTLPKDAFAFHCPNGGSRNIIEATNLKRQGLKAGVPDIIIIWAGRVFGLELKSKSGKVLDSQRTVFPLLRAAGMRVEIARSYNEAIDLIKQFGIPLRIANDEFGARDDFREATRRRT